MNQNTYNIYCDESSIENCQNKYMIIGALFMKRELRDELKNKIKDLKKKYGYRGEIKWNKTSKKLLPLYKEIIDLFIDYGQDVLQYHCIKIDRFKIKYKIYHNNDIEEGFYKFYYQLLKNKFKDNCSYYLFLDYKPTKSKKRVVVLEHYLKYRISNYSNSKIKSVQAQHSDKNVLIQIADLFTGAVNFEVNSVDKISESKKELIKYLAEKIKKENLQFCSTLSETKFNIFCIDLK
ncbi:DUF3800 domain-containing protein [Patescibacteria group bacterium]|nr:DUF3800 domain-containing protein [Patescibacteria group bacterium]MBU4142152.1 DUF3800 domain-containing protein [Patescibacteria group bacterium]